MPRPHSTYLDLTRVILVGRVPRAREKGTGAPCQDDEVRIAMRVMTNMAVGKLPHEQQLDLADLLPQPQVHLGDCLVIHSIHDPFPAPALGPRWISEQESGGLEFSEIGDDRRRGQLS